MVESLSVWNDCFERRLDWAYRAKDDFINSIDNKTFKSLYNKNSNHSVNIAVYGQSQVGKTTLILKLIGIKEDCYEEVSNILRADIPKGQSVTPTTIIYLKSRDNHFYYREGDNEYRVNKNELKVKLKDLRTRVEKNSKISSLKGLESNVLIKIPRIYFKEKINLDLKIIDLPGYGSANDREQRHVKKVIKSIVPILNLALIVSNKITDLVKSDKPCRNYRYILTRSVSSESVRKRFDSNRITNKTQYIKFVEQEFGNDLNGDIVYPLEYGDSWSILDKRTKDKAEDIINDLFEDLRRDILQSSTEYNQLMQNANHYKYIEQIISHQLEEYRKEKEAKVKALEELKSNIEDVKELRDNYKKKYDLLIQEKLDVTYVFNCTLQKFKGEITVASLKKFLETTVYRIIEKGNEEWKKLKERYHEVNFPSSLGLIGIGNNESLQLRSKLNNYWVDWYLTDNDEKDRKECEEVEKKIYKQIKSRIETTFRNEVEKYNKGIEKKVNKSKQLKEANERRIINIKVLIENLEGDIKEIKKEKRNFIKKSNSDLETAKKFKDYLAKEYVKEKNRATDIINNRQTSTELRFFNFLYLSLLASEFEKLISQPV